MLTDKDKIEALEAGKAYYAELAGDSLKELEHLRKKIADNDAVSEHDWQQQTEAYNALLVERDDWKRRARIMWDELEKAPGDRLSVMCEGLEKEIESLREQVKIFHDAGQEWKHRARCLWDLMYNRSEFLQVHAEAADWFEEE